MTVTTHSVPLETRQSSAVTDRAREHVKQRTMSPRAIAYLVTTVLVAFSIRSGGIGELARWPGNLEVATILGYPVYFLTIIGIWKVLGAIAIVVPAFPRLKEWAYAGIFFKMTGAAASHAFSGDYGDYAWHIIATLCIALLAVAS